MAIDKELKAMRLYTVVSVLDLVAVAVRAYMGKDVFPLATFGVMVALLGVISYRRSDETSRLGKYLAILWIVAICVICTAILQ